MGDNMKEDTPQVDTACASLSADLSLLDELFPSLGNGESSANHFTNQLALLLNNLGSSDDEGSNGPNLYNPLQLSPPRLNEIHALATANLISQTQEAIMQEYNITNFDFEKSTHSDIAENEQLISKEMNFQDDSQVVCNTDQMHKLENIQENATPDVNNSSSSNVDNVDLVAETSRNFFKADSQTLNSLNGFGHDYVLNSTTKEDLNIDKTCLTKVKIKACDETFSMDKRKDDNFDVLKQQHEQHLRSQLISDHDLETQSAVYNISDSCSAAQNENVISLQSTNVSFINRIERNSDSSFHSSINRPPSDEESPPKLLMKRSLENLDHFDSNTYVEHTELTSDIKKSHEVLNYVLPPKKRHLECNKVPVTFTDNKSRLTGGSRNVHCNSLQNEAKARSNSCVSKELSSKENEKEKSILYICVICMKQFSNVDDLELHSSNHQQYICPYPGCVRTFTYRSHLSYHRQTHEGQKNYQCSECGKVFTKAQHLDVHMLTHREAKPFVCSVCSKSFTTAGNLKNHARTHSGERPYACDTKDCIKTFAELSSLKKHKVTHTGEKSFKCDICGKGFAQASSRSYHMKKHKEKM
ncbi:zinc finger protein 79-like [Mercenaria mercenaria]|uniref:zinc finger protein 79-like n=1 Tax=Mercenaria mercenaria TaxID=6596 RepID=UPI001E1DD21B|nr:zinc finger protein 79-like [Mercenaria mercenaria]XP_045160133.1 zinc finger protein 79-like [Mercenaria mercenaria]XP_045160141.1 zinc finger protein 79-like [Mercenaria mercenaria]XP_045160150.1 zinc finger protein 79-like [Mercenaria mercenaria]XP_045160160.1 zinc finger protein 79-like [Mercenaria mercenaria]XP_053377124.1 zinc finger protein 79-like [Mercenaria mercenaria]